MTRITQQQHESYLWGAAVLLQGTIDAGDYKQFIFPLLFYKRLCDVFDEETVTALRESGGDEDFAMFPENHRFQVRADVRWGEIRKVSRDAGRGWQHAMRKAQTDAATESTPTALPDALAGWLENSRKVRDSLQTLLAVSAK
jgi:type I restriction enzyme M protein